MGGGWGAGEGAEGMGIVRGEVRGEVGCVHRGRRRAGPHPERVHWCQLAAHCF